MKMLLGKPLFGLCAALVLTLSAATALAATDATGSWTGTVQTPNGDEMKITVKSSDESFPQMEMTLKRPPKQP